MAASGRKAATAARPCKNTSRATGEMPLVFRPVFSHDNGRQPVKPRRQRMSPRTTWRRTWGRISGRAWGLAALAAAALMSAPAQAQTPYPSRPIRMLVTIPPGGAPDISARLVAQGLQEAHGWTIVIENRTGANGNVAMAEVAK